MFGRGNKGGRGVPEPEQEAEQVGEAGDSGDTLPHGPWDSSEIDTGDAEGQPESRLDLGSVRVPIPEGGQIQVEMENSGVVRSVHLLTPDGRITVAAFAAPRSAGLWREVATELAQGLRVDQARVSIEEGPWGREVVGVNAAGTIRFLGVDGPRWMLRCVAAGAPETADALRDTARAVLQDTVVVRGAEPMPVRTALPVTVPEVLAQQLELARQQAAEQALQQAAELPDQRSAWQQLQAESAPTPPPARA